MKTQDHTFARMIHWYLELEDRHTTIAETAEPTPFALQPTDEDGPICLEQLNETTVQPMDLMR